MSKHMYAICKYPWYQYMEISLFESQNPDRADLKVLILYDIQGLNGLTCIRKPCGSAGMPESLPR